MKQNIIAFIMLFLVMSVGVFAENVTETVMDDLELPDAGMTPDSPLYGIELAIEKIQLALERDPAKRAERALMHAEERLAEVQVMVEANKLKAAERAQKRHTELFAEIEEEISDKDQKPVDAFANSLKLEEKVEKHRSKIEKVKVSFESKEEFLNEMSRLWDEMEGNMDSVEVRIDNAKEKVKVVMENNGIDVESLENDIRENGLDRALERVKNENAREHIIDARDRKDNHVPAKGRMKGKGNPADFEFSCPSDDQRDEMKENCEAQGFEYEIEYEQDCELIVCQYPQDFVAEEFDAELEEMMEDMEDELDDLMEDYEDDLEDIIEEVEEDIENELDNLMDDLENDMEDDLDTMDDLDEDEDDE